MRSQLHVLVSGRVQGVFFRDSTRNVAKRLGLTGWVWNLDDGRVEVIAEGDKEKLEELLSHLHQGPLLSKVTTLKISWENYTGKFHSFEIKY